MKKTITINDNPVSQPSEPEISTNISSPVVGIGASAGGLDALGQFFGNVPKNSGIAFMVIKHLDPNHVGIIDQHEKSIGVLNVETNDVFWSDEIFRLFDCEPQEFDASYKAFIEFIHPEDREKVNFAYLKSLETKTEYHIEYRIITKNKQLKYVKETCTTTFNEQGKPLSSFSIVIDITESKQAEITLQKSIEEIAAQNEEITVQNEELNQSIQELFVAKVKAEESEEKFRAMYNNAPLSYQSLDENGCFIDINPMWSKTLGYERVEVIGKWYGDFLHPDYIEHFRINFPAFKKRGYVSDVQFKLRRKDNSYINVSFEGCVGYTAEGKFKQTYCVFKDITEQKALENALIKAREKAEESEQRFKSLIENAPDGVVIIDGNGKFKYVSPNAERLFGYNENEGVSLSGDESTHPDDLPLILTTLQTILDDPKQKPTVEYRFKRKNGEFRWIETTFTNLLSDKAINGIILNFTDVTERKQIFEELIIAKEKAERNEIELIKAQNIAHLGSWYLNVETNEVVWTEELYQMYGFDPTLPPPPYTEHMKLFTPESWEMLSTSLAKTRETGIPYELELRTIRKDNSNGWMWVRGEAVLDESNKIIGLWGAAQDITVRKLSELDLEISQKKTTKLNTLLNAILESPQDMIVFALDNKYCYTAFTKAHKQAMKSLWGVDIKVGDNMLDYISRSEDRNKARNSFGRCLRGEFFIMKEENGDSSLQRKYYETRYSPLFNELKEIIGLTVFNIDITERKLMEDTQAFLLQISNPGSVENFFESLAIYLAQCLDMEYVCIDLLEGDRLTAKTLAIYNEGNFDPNVSYALKDTPCGEVVGNHICCYPQKVRSLFPNDAALEDIKAESYIGTTLWSFDGQPIGLIAVIGQKPLQNQELAASVLKLVALRAAGKLEATMADEKLRESEEKYRLLYESMDQGLALHEIITDENGNPVDYRFLDINDSYTRILGITREMSIGKRIRELMPKVEQYWIDIFGKVALTGESNYYENYLETTGRYYSTYSYCPKKNHFAVLVNDITERKLAEEKLRKSEERYALVIEASEQGIWDWNVETNEVFYSEQWKKQIGYKDDELKNEFNTWVEHLHPNEKEYCQNTLLSYLNKPVEHFILDFRFRHKDGTYRWIHNKAASQKNNEGKVIRLFGTHTDITESKLSEAIFKDIIEKNPMSIQILDMEGYPIQVNSAHTKLFGVEILPDYSVFKDSQLLSLGFGELFERVKKGEVVMFPDSYYNVHDVDPSFPDSPVWVKALGFTLNDNNGKPNRLVFMHENITDRRFAEQELIKSKEHAEESDRLKSAFLANMSHEIRTPMNGILGFSELLKEPGLTGDQQQEYIRIIEKSGKRMLNIINDIIDISKIEARLMNLNICESNVNGQIEYIYTFFKPEVEAKGMKLSFRNSLTTKEAIIKTDREKLYAILTNLVKNAVKYSNEGEIEIGYKKVEMQSIGSPQCNSFLQFYVKDTGIGIPKNRQEAIFERFIQADIADKMALQGAGLGLAITKSYIEMLGGEIWVESEEGIGSTFYFTLPYNAELVEDTSDRHTQS